MVSTHKSTSLRSKVLFTSAVAALAVGCGSAPDEDGAVAEADPTAAEEAAQLQAEMQAARSPGARCSTRPVASAEIQRVNVEMNERLLRMPAGMRPLAIGQPINVPVWFHVINKGTGAANGDLTS